jgi:predicted kinase
MNKVAYLLIGPSGSGKSSFIEQLKVDHAGQDVGVFSLDTCRLAYYAFHATEHGVMCGGPDLRYMKFDFPTGREEAVDFYRKAFDFCNEAGADFSNFVTTSWLQVRDNNDVVIVDNTNVTRKSRTRWVNDLRNARTAGQFGFHIVAAEFQTPLRILNDRQATRADKSIPFSALTTQYFRQEAALLGSECDEVRVINTVPDAEYLPGIMTLALMKWNKYVNDQQNKEKK